MVPGPGGKPLSGDNYPVEHTCDSTENDCYCS